MKKIDSSVVGWRLSVWRWYAPATLVNGSNDESLMSSGTLQKLLAVIGYPNSGELMSALEKTQRNALPKPLQRKLSRAFSLDTFMYQDDPEFLFRGMSLEVGQQQLEVPYPLVPVAPLTAEIVVAGFGVERVKRTKAQVHVRVSVATNEFLSPRTAADAAFISTFFLGAASLDGELEKEDQKTLTQWLKSSGLGAEVVLAILEDTDLRSTLRDQVLDRIEEMVSVCAMEDITDDEGNTYVLEGEEEKGFARAPR